MEADELRTQPITVSRVPVLMSESFIFPWIAELQHASLGSLFVHLSTQLDSCCSQLKIPIEYSVLNWQLEPKTMECVSHIAKC